ncbi:MAG TPA: hypothetical protein VMU32_07320 [Solirubrobacteraceae bacterium]|nr:hypothetical protein [Solirubrobacteraceae bacterium]
MAEKLADLRTSDAQPRAIVSRRQRFRRPGWVLDAVHKVMADQPGPMRVAQVHAAVEALLGEAPSLALTTGSWTHSEPRAVLSPAHRARSLVAGRRRYGQDPAWVVTAVEQVNDPRMTS